MPHRSGAVYLLGAWVFLNAWACSSRASLVLDDSLASGNGIVGINIDLLSTNVTILDTRSSNVAPTTLNPAYTLNVGFDILGTATVITTS